MLSIQGAIKGEKDDIRASLANISALIESSFKTKYGLAEDYYE